MTTSTAPQMNDDDRRRAAEVLVTVGMLGSATRARLMGVIEKKCASAPAYRVLWGQTSCWRVRYSWDSLVSLGLLVEQPGRDGYCSVSPAYRGQLRVDGPDQVIDRGFVKGLVEAYTKKWR